MVPICQIELAYKNMPEPPICPHIISAWIVLKQGSQVLKSVLVWHSLYSILVHHYPPLVQDLSNEELLQGHTKTKPEVIQRGDSNKRVGQRKKIKVLRA